MPCYEFYNYFLYIFFTQQFTNKKADMILIFYKTFFPNWDYWAKHTDYFKASFPIPQVLFWRIALEVKETGIKEDLYAVEKLAISLGLKEWYIITRNYVDSPGFIPAYMV